MGFVDADTHVLETEATWSYLADDEARFRPNTLDTDGSQTEWHGLKRFWYTQGQLIPRGLTGLHVEGIPADAVRMLDDVPGRVAWMDRLGIETQIVISSFFIVTLFSDADAQVALARSYNRWMADCCKPFPERLRWSVALPLHDMEAAVEEIRFGAANGAASVLMRAHENKRLLSDEYFDPIYAEAEKFDLSVGVHIGNTFDPTYTKLNGVMFAVAAMTGAFVNVFTSNLGERFPGLRFSFLEAGAEWLPFAMRAISRGIDGAARRDVELDETPLAGTNLYIACTYEEDLPQILKFSGEDNLVLGTDFGHSDFGLDLEAHRGLLARTDVDQRILRKIVDTNGRRLYGLERAAEVAA